MDGVRLLSVSSALLDQRGKGHRQDVFALPCALASPGYLGQLHKETKPELNTWTLIKYETLWSNREQSLRAAQRTSTVSSRYFYVSMLVNLNLFFCLLVFLWISLLKTILLWLSTGTLLEIKALTRTIKCSSSYPHKRSLFGYKYNLLYRLHVEPFQRVPPEWLYSEPSVRGFTHNLLWVVLLYKEPFYHVMVPPRAF